MSLCSEVACMKASQGPARLRTAGERVLFTCPWMEAFTQFTNKIISQTHSFWGHVSCQYVLCLAKVPTVMCYVWFYFLIVYLYSGFNIYILRGKCTKRVKKEIRPLGCDKTLSTTVAIVIWECWQHSHPSFLEHWGASHEEGRVEQQILKVASKQWNLTELCTG